MKNRYILAAFLLCLLPFVQRSWLFDDPSFILAAKAAAAHPLDPYHFHMDVGRPDSQNWVVGQRSAQTNPPLSAWILGGVIKLAGEREEILHLAIWVFALALVVLAQKIIEILGIGKNAGLLFVFSPVVFLSSLTLYPHVLYLAFYLLSLWLALRDNHKPQMVGLMALGISLTLAFLSLDHWPVLILLIVVLMRRRCILPLGLFILLAGSWSLWEIHFYGTSHFWSDLHWRGGGVYPLQAAFLPVVFLAGGLPMIAVAWPYLLSRSRIVFAGLSILALVSWAIFSSARGGFSALLGGLLAFELATGIAFLVSLGWMWKENSDLAGRRIIGWFLVEFLFIQRYLVYPSGHHLLMIALPVALLSTRMADILCWSSKIKYAGFLILTLLTLSLAVADQEEAAIGPKLSRDVSGFSGPRYYWGNDFSGFCYYLKATGWKAFDPRTPAKSGDIILVPRNLNVQGAPRFLAEPGYRLLGVQIYRIAMPLRTLSLGDSAGWYSASWGALPYSISRSPAEVFFIYSRS